MTADNNDAGTCKKLVPADPLKEASVQILFTRHFSLNKVLVGLHCYKYTLQTQQILYVPPS
jgi:hypothetical protein